MRLHSSRWALGLVVAAGLARAAEGDFQPAVEADWARQERRAGRQPGTAAAVQAAWKPLERLWAVRRLEGVLSADLQARLGRVREEVAGVGEADAAARQALYLRTRWLARDLALASPRFQGRPLVFMQRNRFVCQMLHEYMGYFCDYGDVSGGGVYRLEEPGRSAKAQDLIAGRLPKGNYTTLALSLDARTVYFAFSERAPTKPAFNSPDRRGFNLYALDLGSNALRQLTSGREDDFDPCPLPDGGLAFMSTRRGGFARCNNSWEPCASYTLHRMDGDGGNIRTLSFHETSEWHPSLLNDGRIVYIRWDYVDRSAANFHGLWASNPDGSGVTSLFGNYTMKINACYQPKAIPGSGKIVFVAGAHHADVGGSLVLLDPSRARLNAQSGEDEFSSLEFLTPDICFPEADGWPKSYFHGPQPLSEDEYLVAFSFDPLPGMSSGESRDTRTGLYYFDRYGSLELLYFDPTISSMYPLLLTPRKGTPALVEQRVPGLIEEGEFLLANVYLSLMPLPAGRQVTELRVYQILPKVGSHTANDPRIGHANAENARMFLGSLPVEKDGSAYFRAPARKPLYFQAVDERGRAVQGMRSVTYLQPGERRSCIGCHEPVGQAAPSQPALAAQRAPSRLRAGPPGTQPFSYPLLVQPILEAHCVKCHDGQAGPGKSALDLTAAPAQPFSRSYQNLKPYLRWYEWGGASISQIATHPGRQGADESRLAAVLDDANHRAQELPDQARRALYLWLDANSPFFGTYDKTEQAAQLSGRRVPPPAFQ